MIKVQKRKVSRKIYCNTRVLKNKTSNPKNETGYQLIT